MRHTMRATRRAYHVGAILPAALLVLLVCANVSSAADRVVLNFNPDWRFLKADPPGASAAAFDDRTWSLVSAPHTYNDVDTFDNWSTPGHRGEQLQWGGRTWYRKSFPAPAAWRGRRVFIEFEGVRQVAEVYLNGQLLGVSKTGFTPFGFDLTPYLRFDAANVLAVMCDNRFMTDPLDAEASAALGTATAGGKSVPNPNLAQLSAKVNETIPDRIDDLAADQIPWNNPHWHPAHGGIYRNVRLHVTDPLHMMLPLYSYLQTAGPYVYATEISGRSARVSLEVPVQNGRAAAAQVALQADVLDADGTSVLVLIGTKTVAAGATAQFDVSGLLANPRRWEPSYPHVYRVVCTLRINGQTVDSTAIPLGIRDVRWDATAGLFINGHAEKLHGWGQKPTNEWPGLGAALPDWMHFYTLRLMKDAGGTFLRWGHAAAGPAQIAAADRLGLGTDQPGVDGESDTRGAAWTLRAAAFRDTIIYFRNNPSILIWEGGNQKVSRDHAQELRGLMDTFDPHGGRAYAHRRADQITAEFMDVGIGTEGGREIARLPVVEGEYDREESPRRVWDAASPPHFGYPEAKGQTYQLTSEQFAVNQVAQFVKKLGAPDHSGGANWIFSDSTSGGRVAVEVARASGEVDAVRLPKEAYFVCAAMFRADPQVHIIGHWTYPAGTTKTVYVASNAENVELFVNGTSKGRGTVSDYYLFTFPNVTWEPGEVKAVARMGGAIVATAVTRTAGLPVALKLTPMTAPGGVRADGSDILLVDVEAVDARGERCPTTQQRVDFEFVGPGTWRGGYNSGKVDSTNHTYLDLEAGINRVAIRAGRVAGRLTLRATSAGLSPAIVMVESHGFPAEGGASTTAPAWPAVRLPARAAVRAVSTAATASSSVPARNAATAPSSAPARDAATAPSSAPARDTGAAPTTSPAAASTGRVIAAPRRTASPAEASRASRTWPGRFVKAFNYSGPSSYLVHVEIQARDGRNAYVDGDLPFAALPLALTGADWIQAANREASYQAGDLMELAVIGNTVVSVAHDDGLPRPSWLTQQFTPTPAALILDGHRMAVFERLAPRDESLTLGANADGAAVTAANMYIVFVNGRLAGK